ncbi:MAG: Tuftelin-interacting protein 11 [Marteilia pararefringens]
MPNRYGHVKSDRSERERKKDINTYGIWSEEDNDMDNSERKKKRSSTSGHGHQNYNDYDGVPIPDDAPIGKWEEHTKGIGMKLLQKMGYKSGEGLGAHGQGIKKPVEMKKASGSQGKGVIIGELLNKPNNEDKQELAMKKFAKSRPVKTVNELIETNRDYGLIKRANFNQKINSHEKIIDKTGKQEKVFDSFSDLSKMKNDIELFTDDIQPLMNNLDQIISQIETEILDSNFKDQEYAQSLQNLTADFTYHENIVAQKSSEIKDVSSIIESLEILENLSKDHSLNPEIRIEKAVAIYNNLKSSDISQFTTVDVVQTLLSAFEPTIIEMFNSWMPLENPFFGYDKLASIIKLISNSSKNKESMNHFERIIKKSWINQLIILLNTITNFKNQSSFFANFIVQWSKIIDANLIRQSLIQPIIIQILIREIRNMNPNIDFQKAYLWILPWKGLTGQSMAMIYSELLNTFGHSLQTMTISDPRIISKSLQPLSKHIGEQALSNFSSLYLLPIICSCILRLEFNIFYPDQSCSTLCNILEMKDLIPSNQISHVFNKFFFPKWISYVSSCLGEPSNLESVVNFYQTFKSKLTSLFPELEALHNGFNETILIMNRSLSGTPNDLNYQHISTLNSNFSSKFQNDQSLKESIERKCIQNNLNFIPMPARSSTERMLYKIGHLTINIHQNNIFLVPPEGLQYAQEISFESLFEKL